MTTPRTTGRRTRSRLFQAFSGPRRRVASRLGLLTAGLAVVASSIVTLGVVSSAAAAQVTVNASADSYIQSDQPDTNFGTLTQVTVRALADKPACIAYIKFVVSGLSAAPAGVQLRLYSYAQSATGVQVYSAASNWTETGLTWNTAPAPGATMVANMSGLAINAYATADVSSVVTGNGTYTFAISTTSTLGKQLASREVSADPPQLVINTAGSTTIATSAGSGQSTPVNSAFAAPLVAKVADGTGSAVSGVQVTFTAPASGASATFPGGVTAVSVATDANGLATAPVLTANGTTGGYSVTASTDGVSTPASFALTNGSAASPSPSPSASPSHSPSASPSTSPSQSASPSTSPSASASPSVSVSPSASVSPSVSVSPSPSSSPTGGTPTTATFKANADSYVRSDQADTNFGTEYTLGSEAGSATTPTITTYLKFTVTGVTGTITSVTLQLYSYATSSLGVVVSATATGWTETGITYNNAPAVGAAVGNGPNISVNTWASITLTGAVSGSGTYAFAVTTARTANNKFASHESTATPPQLVITSVTGGSPSPSPSPSVSTGSPTPSPSTSSPSATPSPTFTVGPTPTPSPSTVGTSISPVGGAVQTAMVGTPFAAPLAAKVLGSNGSPVPGAMVTFTAPAGDPTGTFPGGAATVTVTADAGGVATSPPFTAGQLAGSYAVSATANGAVQAASFTLTNRDPMIVAAGDIACPAGKTPSTTQCQQKATSDLALSLHPDAVLPLGDDQYELGDLSDFQSQYDSSWGRLNPISYPAPGNHEYGYIGSDIEPTGGTGYFTYFGDRSHPLAPGCTTLCTSWYSWNIGSWHMIALDSQCAVINGCNPGNPEYNWLQADLKANANKCVLAYWHIPIYSSSQDHQPDMQAIYQLLYTKGADLILTGHAHFYERFNGQDGAGNADPVKGIPEFIVGTGGRSFFAIRPTPAANSATSIANTFGVLQMTLSANSYTWNFVPTNDGGSLDQGGGNCH